MKAIAQSVAREQVIVKEDGVSYRMMTVEAILKVIQREALSGDLRAKQLMDKVREKYGVDDDDGGGYGYLVVPEAYTLENCPFPIEDVDEEIQLSPAIRQ